MNTTHIIFRKKEVRINSNLTLCCGMISFHAIRQHQKTKTSRKKHSQRFFPHYCQPSWKNCIREDSEKELQHGTLPSWHGVHLYLYWQWWVLEHAQITHLLLQREFISTQKRQLPKFPDKEIAYPQGLCLGQESNSAFTVASTPTF